jgi:hypothetical protein
MAIPHRMRKLKLFPCFLLSLSFTACGMQHLNSQTINASVSNPKTYQQIAITDSLRDPNSYYYLTDFDLKLIGKWILSDSLFPSDNFVTFRLMDSLDSDTYSERQFYLKVFLHIMEKADGALAEAVGSPALAYVERHTKEFFELNPPLSKDQFERWANYVGVEIYLSVNNNEKEAGQKYITGITDSCKGCSAKALKKVEEFGDIITESIVNIKE